MKNRLIALLLAVTAGCVTETQGPEPVVVDDKQAISQRVALARQYIGAGDWDNAKRNLELAASIDEDNPEVLEAFALVFQSTGEFELAAANFTRALEGGAGSRVSGGTRRYALQRPPTRFCEPRSGLAATR